MYMAIDKTKKTATKKAVSHETTKESKSAVSHETAKEEKSTVSHETVDIAPKKAKRNELVKDDLTVDDVKYPLSYAPAKIDFTGKKQLEQDIDKIVALFSDVNVTADYAKQAKKERAHINKLISAIKESQQRVVGVVASDILKWEDDNKKQVKRLQDLSNKLKDDIDKWALVEKEHKHADNLKHIGKMLEANGYGESYISKVESDFYNTKWDNKTFSYATFEKEVNQVISQFKAEDEKRANDIKVILDACHNSKSRLGEGHWIDELDSGKSLPEVLADLRAYDQSVQDAITHSYQASAEPAIDDTADDNVPTVSKINNAGDALEPSELTFARDSQTLEEPIPSEFEDSDFPEPEPVYEEPPNAPATYVAGNKVIDSETGEIVEDYLNIKLSLNLTKKQLQAFIPVLKNFIDANNIDYSRVTLKETD